MWMSVELTSTTTYDSVVVHRCYGQLLENDNSTGNRETLPTDATSAPMILTLKMINENIDIMNLI